MHEVVRPQGGSGYHRHMSARRILLSALSLLLLAPALAVGAAGAPATSMLTLVEIACALGVLAVILAAARHARARTARRERVWLPPSWSRGDDL